MAQPEKFELHPQECVGTSPVSIEVPSVASSGQPEWPGNSQTDGLSNEMSK